MTICPSMDPVSSTVAASATDRAGLAGLADEAAGAGAACARSPTTSPWVSYHARFWASLPVLR